MANKTIKHVSVLSKFEVISTNETDLRAKEFEEFSIMLYGKMGWGRSLAYQHGCRNINVWRFSKL